MIVLYVTVPLLSKYNDDCVLFAFKNRISTRQHILISIFIFISVNCHDRLDVRGRLFRG